MPISQADAVRPAARQHTDKPNGVDTQVCPYCGQPISRKEFREIQARIEADEKARLAELETALTAKAQAEIEKIKHDALTEVGKVRREAALQQAAIRKQATEAATAALAPKIAAALNTEKTRWFAERLKLTEQLEALKRKLENTHTTAHQRGEPAEVDLFEALETAFPADRLWRVVKGQKGPDVVVEVIHAGEPVGKIILDSKNHARWSNKFTSKLRADQLAEGADFAILSTSVFPAGAQQLHIQDNVIVASPARVIVLVHLLRRQIVENFRSKLSADARNQKADRLYDFIISPTCTDLLDRIVTLTGEMADLDRTETTAHQKTWTKRADLIRSVQAIHDEFSTAVTAIIAGDPS